MGSLLFPDGAGRLVCAKPSYTTRPGAVQLLRCLPLGGSANATRSPPLRGPHVDVRARVSTSRPCCLPVCLSHTHTLARERPTPAQNGNPVDPQISETTLPGPLGGGDGAAAGLGELAGLMPNFGVNFAHGAAHPPRHRHLDEQHAALDHGLRRHVLRPLVPTLQVSGRGGMFCFLFFECCRVRCRNAFSLVQKHVRVRLLKVLTRQHSSQQLQRLRVLAHHTSPQHLSYRFVGEIIVK